MFECLSKAVILLQLFIACAHVVLYVVFCCPHLFLISPSFGTSGGLCCVIVAFPLYLHLYSSMYNFVRFSFYTIQRHANTPDRTLPIMDDCQIEIFFSFPILTLLFLVFFTNVLKSSFLHCYD